MSEIANESLPETRPEHTTENGRSPRGSCCQFTLWQLLVAVSVLGVLFGLGVKAIQTARERANRHACPNALKMIGLSLLSYHDRHKAFPPAALADAEGNPLFSWRVRVIESVNYDIEFDKGMDFSKPWNAPENLGFLESLGTEGVFKCRPGDQSNPHTTHYVAVTGPGTLWAADLPRIPRSAKGRAAIIIVEWPRSDIHWAEPRDITVDEFMAWFTSGDAQREAHHPGIVFGLDVSGEVQQISLNADPEEVRQMFMVGPDEPKP
ncbi:MAG: DUF1559 domain-containing protein [Pirellulales bacterium]|nr:DUF1559 domain-containing protein [Pirellulales bacterium]